MITTFSVLDRHQSVHNNILLEASAGTGKTFAIENIVARLLIESSNGNEPLSIEDILVVTFTRAATRELKERIRSNLEKNLTFLKFGQNAENRCPDYLLPHIEGGAETINRARCYIEQALYSFDRAQIYTIHGFCWRMLKCYALEARISLDASSCEETSQYEIMLRRGVRDFLRTQLMMPKYSTQQLKILMQAYKRKEDALETEIIKEITKGLEVIPTLSFDALFTLFQKNMFFMQSQFSFSKEHVIVDMLMLAESYKGLHTRDGVIKDGILMKIERLGSILDKNEWTENDFEILIEDGLFFIEAFDATNLKAKKKSNQDKIVHYPHLIDTLTMHLEKIIAEARNEASIFSRVICDCRNFLKEYQEEEEMFGHNDLLIQMRRAVEVQAFSDNVRNCFSAAIIDEFQDTDPLQWEIFSKVFLNSENPWNGILQLVGDPKQSIYAFRQADIYTYLSAAHSIGADAHATLDTNYRSLPPLVEALNALFNAAHDIFPLPRISKSLPFRDAKAGIHHENLSEKCLNFFVAKAASGTARNIEEDYFFPTIADEIISLKENQNLLLSQCAILVSDRYQADRLTSYLNSRNIHVKPQRGKDLSKSDVIDAMREIIEGILHYQSKSALQVALGGGVIGMTLQELIQLEDENNILPVLERCDYLKRILNEQGFALFYREFMQSTWHADNKTIAEKLLARSEGYDFYRQWQDLADFLITEEYDQHLSPYALTSFLNHIDEFSRTDEDRLLTYIDPDEDGVAILTTYVSKGLEFDVVFALGLLKRKKISENNLIPVHEGQECRLYAPTNASDVRYKKHCEELDAEKMRQLYVALTRAKLCLYIPVIVYEKPKEVSLGCASPIELLMARLNNISSYEEIYQKISTEDGTSLENFVASHPSLMTIINIQNNKDIQSDIALKCQDVSEVELIAPNEISIPVTIEMIQSFTSLSSSKSAESHHDEQEHATPHDFTVIEKSEHTLPAGNEVGILLHEILENISLNCVKNYSDALSFVEVIIPFVRKTRFDAWKEIIALIVYNALTTPLPESSPPFCLADVNPKKIYREIDFLYPCSDDSNLIGGCVVKPGFLKGVIDLFFEHEGKYYLVDWKSNWLGPNASYYKDEQLSVAMQNNHYDLQADIYAKAMERYLKIFDNRSFDDIFGGAYYLFLRGISLNRGIYLCRK